jgi:replicative DNA helicase
LNRGVEARQDHRPMLSDLRESGELEQDADVVLLLHRDEIHNPNTDRRGIADLIVAKSRNGPTGAIPLRWMPSQVRFCDLEQYRTPDYQGQETF